MSGISITADTSTQFETGAAEFNSVCRLDDNTFAVAYRDGNDGNKGKINVGSRSGTTPTISESNAVTFNNDETDYITVRSLSSSKIIISFRDVNSGIGYVVCATISGSITTLGTAIAVDAVAQINGLGLAVLDSTNFVITRFYTSAYFSYVCSVSGTTISKGSFQQSGVGDGSNSSTTIPLGADSLGLDGTRFICVYSNTTLRARVGTVNTGAQTISFGTEVVLIGTSASWLPHIEKFDSQHIIVASAQNFDSTIKVIASSINLTSMVITPGNTLSSTVVTYNNQFSICGITANNFLLSYYQNSNTEGEIVSGTLNGGSTIAFDAQGAQIFDNGACAYTSLCKLTDTYFLLGFKKG